MIDDRWQYSRDGVALHDLLAQELSDTIGTRVDLSELKFAHIMSDECAWSK